MNDKSTLQSILDGEGYVPAFSTHEQLVALMKETIAALKRRAELIGLNDNRPELEARLKELEERSV